LEYNKKPSIRRNSLLFRGTKGYYFRGTTHVYLTLHSIKPWQVSAICCHLASTCGL